MKFAVLDARAYELSCAYLRKYLAAHKSADTLQTIRASLRMLFRNRQLTNGVELPMRLRRNITRSRGPKAHDRHFQPKNWPDLLNLLEAAGLRRDEVTMLKVGDIVEHDPDYDSAAAEKVTQSLGHHRLSIILKHYIR